MTYRDKQKLLRESRTYRRLFWFMLSVMVLSVAANVGLALSRREASAYAGDNFLWISIGILSSFPVLVFAIAYVFVRFALPLIISEDRLKILTKG